MQIIKGSIKEVRKEIDKQAGEGKEVVVQGKDIAFNRLILENKKVSALILSHTDKKDRLKQRDSGKRKKIKKQGLKL